MLLVTTILEAPNTFSADELVKYLNLTFQLEKEYKSLNSDRWKLSDHYYVETFKSNGVSVDVLNIDTNFADSHGVMQICCQFYGYIKKKKLSAAEAKKLGNTCNDRIPGGELCAGRCAGGSNAMNNACADTINGGMAH
ncbi:hypothetical protein PsorP6_006169 [Peronosclerospora sorghi]|uniref:Uncharacterized protein n=1 Tax=Peronosclerospora sorghi TaxID=230839 RepID=A0ACC0W3H7_9STRA|nr:hypothetical protein PsorP6_006169 [Peronosclerospora sorghi]